MGLKFSPLIVGHFLGPLSMFGLLVGTSWTHSYSSPNSPDGDIIRLTYFNKTVKSSTKAFSSLHGLLLTNLICISVYVCASMCEYMWIWVCACVCACPWACFCVYVYVCVCMYVWVYVGVSVCMHVCVCICGLICRNTDSFRNNKLPTIEYVINR